MPQLDLFTFTSQFFWLSFFFWGLYAGSFLNFILPFAFTIKIREYLSVYIGHLLNTNTFSTRATNIINTSFGVLGMVFKTHTSRYAEDMVSLANVAKNSINTLRDDTQLTTVKTYLSLTAVTNLLISNRAVSAVARLASSSKLGLKNGKTEKVVSKKPNLDTTSKAQSGVSTSSKNTTSSKKR